MFNDRALKQRRIGEVRQPRLWIGVQFFTLDNLDYVDINKAIQGQIYLRTHEAVQQLDDLHEVSLRAALTVAFWQLVIWHSTSALTIRRKMAWMSFMEWPGLIVPGWCTELCSGCRSSAFPRAPLKTSVALPSSIKGQWRVRRWLLTSIDQSCRPIDPGDDVERIPRKNQDDLGHLKKLNRNTVPISVLHRRAYSRLGIWGETRSIKIQEKIVLNHE